MNEHYNHYHESVESKGLLTEQVTEFSQHGDNDGSYSVTYTTTRTRLRFWPKIILILAVGGGTIFGIDKCSGEHKESIRSQSSKSSERTTNNDNQLTLSSNAFSK